MRARYFLILCLALLSLGSLAQATIIDTVPVGDVGNTGDYRYGSAYRGDGPDSYGSVGYAFNIGKYEVTAGQYAAFLNAVAATDTYALYNMGMSNTSSGSGITRGGVSGSYTYSVATDFINRPVNYVSWGDSARFANWLHSGQPTGLQVASTTEDGAYYLNGATTDYALSAVTRKAGSTWAITSEDEWYKAAYYKGGGTDAGYWLYPTSSDTAPGRDMADASGNNANYYTGSGAYPIDSGKYTTVAGEFQSSDSPYGTFDQGGNVTEWNEALIYGPQRGSRSGSFLDYDYPLRASSRSLFYPTFENYYIGFRVSEVPGGWQPVPEPSSLIALSGGLGMLLGMRRRRRPANA